MKRWTRKPVRSLSSGRRLLLGGALLWGGCTLSVQGQKAAPDTLLRDHATSAAYYREEAAKARQVAETHEVMLLLYRGEGGKPGSGSSLAEQSAMVQHCEQVVQAFRDAADALDALAQDHGKEAGTPVPSVFMNRGGSR